MDSYSSGHIDDFGSDRVAARRWQERHVKITARRKAKKEKEAEKLKRSVGRPRTLDNKILPIMQDFKRARKAAKISLSSVSRRTGYDRSLCSDWERGEHIPSLAKFQDLCSAIGIKITLSDACTANCRTNGSQLAVTEDSLVTRPDQTTKDKSDV